MTHRMQSSAVAIAVAAVLATPALLHPDLAGAQKKADKTDKADRKGDQAGGGESGADGPGESGEAAAGEAAVTSGEGGEGAGAGAGDAGEAAGDGLAVDELRREYLRLRDQLFQSRARAAAVASALYSTRLTISLNYASARFYSISRATIRLDGANVYDDSAGAVAKDRAPRFEGFVAPGRHLINVRIEATGKDDERFTTAIDNTFAIQAPAARDVAVVITARDDGDIAYAWKKRQRGSYQLGLAVAVTTSKRAAGAGPGDGKGESAAAPASDARPRGRRARVAGKTARP